MPQVPYLNYIRNAITNGQSANSAYRTMLQAARDASETTGDTWTGIGRSTFLGLFSETLAARNKVPDALDYDPDRLPDDTVMTDRTSNRSKGYLTWLNVYARDAGETEVNTQIYVIRSKEPISATDAILKAQSGFQDALAQDHGTLPGSVFLGATYGGTQRLVRPQR